MITDLKLNTVNPAINIKEMNVEKKPAQALVEKNENSKDAFIKEETIEIGVYEAPKKLTAEQINDINRQRAESTMKFVSDSIKQTVANQASQASVYHNGFALSADSADLLTSIFGSLEAALPTPATTPEGALANISEGGAYSVEAVSGRIMKMATALAGDDKELLAEMEEAVKKGFQAAGMDLETGAGMPEITMETYKHVMNEFDKLKGNNGE